MDNITFYETVRSSYIEAGKRLYAYGMKLGSLPHGALTCKQRHGKKYYYMNRRMGGKVVSEYVGTGEDVYDRLCEQLHERERVREERRIQQKEREACVYALCYKDWKRAGEYDFSLYYNDILVADVFADENSVQVFRYEKSFGMQLFYSDEMTRFELGEVLASRCWDENRDNLDLYLAKLGLSEYNVYEICRRTHGIMMQDLFWFKFIGEDFDGTRVLRRCGLA